MIKVTTSVKSNMTGHCVEFTIGNQTFKTVTFLSNISEDQAEQYRLELTSALDGLIGQSSITIDEKVEAEKSLRQYINKNAEISPNSTASSIVHKWLDQVIEYCLSNRPKKPDGVIVTVESGMLFIDKKVCTFETKQIRANLEGMIKDDIKAFNLPDKYTYETNLMIGNKIAKIKLKPKTE